MLSLHRHTLEVPRSAYTPTTAALAPELGRMYAAQCRQQTAEGGAQLREITRALVRRLKGDGLQPERVIVAIKTAIARYGDGVDRPSLASDGEEEPTAHVVYRNVFDCLLATYFDAAAD